VRTADTAFVVPGVVWSIPTLPIRAVPATRTGAVAMDTGCGLEVG